MLNQFDVFECNLLIYENKLILESIFTGIEQKCRVIDLQYNLYYFIFPTIRSYLLNLIGIQCQILEKDSKLLDIRYIYIPCNYKNIQFRIYYTLAKEQFFSDLISRCFLTNRRVRYFTGPVATVDCTEIISNSSMLDALTC